MSWEAPTGDNDWGTGETAVVSGGGGGEWDDAPATGSSEQYAADELNDGAANDYGGYGGGEENGGGGGGRSGGCFNCVTPRLNVPNLQRLDHATIVARRDMQRPNAPIPRSLVSSLVLVASMSNQAIVHLTALLLHPSSATIVKRKCKNPRKIERNDVEDVAAEIAWENLIKQSQEGDFDDMKYEVMKYIKASPDATYVQLENAFRTQNIPIYLIAMEKELTQTYTNMDLQGNLDRKYSVSWRKSSKHSRPKEKESWPRTLEENLERLADAGEPVDRGVPLCSRCNELGHTVKHCTEERVDSERVQVQCFNCSEISGHRVRDCPIPRENKFACRNCKKSGHSSKECPEPRSAEGVECKNCNEIGHFSRDCPTGGGGDGGLCRNCNQPGHRAKDCTNERVMICRNCDEEGHAGKECPKPRDYSRVQCQNCKQMGHTKVRCKEPIAEEDAAGDAAANGGDYGGGDAANDDYSVPAAGGDDDNWATGGGQEVVGGGG
ncbi:hypothetical protein BOTCAL_1115g00030 [Botryotinia calthae]|uniref:CCHC-type domain-containing protein n=1 Tax=Botryotinia calthae TaxID=38488 RepID=A0A4Y8CEF6_9HELO|nr:hypothetical protein BOTCAL_1115g00030 [Botryotinia calthae]